jgi:ATP-dependent helicase HrpB
MRAANERSGLPVAAVLPQLLAALDEAPNAVLVAPPGAGKTTTVPLALLSAPWRDDGRILVLEPRRIAARAAAARMAHLLGEQVGGTVGYRTRLDNAVSAATRVEVVTEGLLVRRLLSDPGLEGVAAIILDEAHERSLDADLALALCLDLQRVLRPELRMLAMSATLDAVRLADLMSAATIESDGRSFPVDVRHAGRELQDVRDLPEAVARAVRIALTEQTGDILAFLPGMAEIRRTEQALEGCGAAVLPLHGELPTDAQDRALRPGDGRRVVLATSIAETSLTVPGVRVVVDGGWRRAPRLDPATGLTRLTTVRISRSAATQRAGRAGRETPGVAIRLWTEALHRGLAEQDRPEMLEAELSGLALHCAAWGTRPEELPFADAPPAGSLAAGRQLLTALGFLDEGQRLTTAGRRAVQVGAHPRLAAMMLAASTPTEKALAATIAAILEERDPMRGRDAPVDLELRLAALEGGVAEVDRGAVSRIRRGAAQYRSRLRVGSVVPEGNAGRLVAAGFPDRIAQSRGEPGSFRLSGGGGASASRADPLAREKLLAVAALDVGRGARIRIAAKLDVTDLPDNVAGLVTETVESGFDPVAGQVLSRRRRRLGTLVLEDRMVEADAAETARVLAEAAAARSLPWTEEGRQVQARVALMRGLEGDDWPDLSDECLRDTAGSWLAPWLRGMTRLTEVARLDLSAALRGMLRGDQAHRLDHELPNSLALPGGRAKLDYTQPVPVAEARAQAFYGLLATPTLACGRVRIRLALLSPAGRPVAVTGDLASFWQGAWADVRKDMRGRYPKHDWPENPTRGQG